MSYAKQMLNTYGARAADAGVLADAIDSMNDCAQACIADTDADLGDENLTAMVACIRLCLDCADVCAATARVTSRPSSYNPRVTEPLLDACLAICALCGEECEMHADTHPHCRVCGKACRRCEQACRDLLAAAREKES
jgi:hypothetical protein